MPVSLQERCIQAWRRSMRDDGYAGLWRAAARGAAMEAAPAGNLVVPGYAHALAAVYMEDVLAHALAHVVFMYDGHVVGGFVRDGVAGKPWRNVDAAFPGPFHQHQFQRHAARQLGLLLGGAPHRFRLEHVATESSFALEAHQRFTARRHRLAWRRRPESADVMIEVHTAVYDDFTKLRLRPPATAGSGLCWTPGGLEAAPAPTALALPCRARDICDMLQQGEDIAILPTHDLWSCMATYTHHPTQAYYARQHRRLRQQGYTHVTTHGISLNDFYASITITVDITSDEDEEEAA